MKNCNDMNKYLTIACAAALSTLMACSGGKGNADKSTDSTAAAETAKETVQAEDSTGNPNASVMDLTIDGFNSKVMDFSGDMPKFWVHVRVSSTFMPHGAVRASEWLR